MSEPARPQPADSGVVVPLAVSRRANTWGLLGAVFLSGGVLLGVEMAASRVLAPYFGNSLFVWASIIGVILGGLALGYWLGGALADRFPTPITLAAVVAAGAVAVLSIPLLDTPSIEWVLRWDPGPRLDPVLCAVILFGPASVLLSAVGPVAVRLQVRALPNVGRTAGRTFAISTAGSIVGTFVTAFWLIPELGIEQLFVFAAAMLFATTMLVGVAARRPALSAAGLVLATATSGYAISLGTQHIDPLSASSARNWSAPYRTRYRYTDLFHLGIAYNTDARRVLYVGLGAGSSEKRLWRDFPQVQIEAVELDPVVVDVAYRYFQLPRDPRLRVEVGDGRRYLARDDRRWDVIVIDAFFADAIPAHLVTQEFLTLVRTRLAPGGVVVTNAIGALEGPGSRLFRSIYKTYRTAFPTVLVHPAILPGDGGEEQFRNLILIATDKAAPGRRQLADRWDALRGANPSVPDLRKPILDRRDGTIATDDVPVLTDDYAPTDALLLLFQ